MKEERTTIEDELEESAEPTEPTAEKLAEPTVPTTHQLAKETALFSEDESHRLHSRWESIQASFIDEPRKSVDEANQLVRDLADRITDWFEEQRGELENVWERGEEVSTEDLRVTLQRYRAFFERLLSL